VCGAVPGWELLRAHCHFHLERRLPSPRAQRSGIHCTYPCCSTVASPSHSTTTSTCHGTGSLIYGLIELIQTDGLRVEHLVGLLDSGARTPRTRTRGSTAG
jgi:hypothetical protein